MNRTIAALTIAAVAVLGLSACSATPSAPEGAEEIASSAAPAETAGGQSVADACAAVKSQLTDAGAALSGLDLQTAAADPQGTLDLLTGTAESIGAAIDSVDNAEVEEAVSAVHEDLSALRDAVESVVVEQDMSAAATLGGKVAEVQESAAAVGTLCAS